MVTDMPPPIISPGTYTDLLEVKRLASKVYFARTNFIDLCAALEKLNEYFDDENARNRNVNG